VRWSIEGKLVQAHACHCSMCRKVHGTGYGAYAGVDASGLEWTAGHDQVTTWRTSQIGQRCFCSRCGSPVPHLAGEGQMGIALGSLEDPPEALRLRAHIFAGSKAPWEEITDGLPVFDAWPPGFDYPVYPTPERALQAEGKVGGSCLCGGVAYEVELPLQGMRHCHCSRCRRARGAPHATNAFTSLTAFRYTRGETQVRMWKVPEARYFAQCFCSACGSAMPRMDASRDLVVIPAGSFDEDPGIGPTEHIFVGSKAPWFAITDALPQKHEM
jgi:hypothetical protein